MENVGSNSTSMDSFDEEPSVLCTVINTSEGVSNDYSADGSSHHLSQQVHKPRESLSPSYPSAMTPQPPASKLKTPLSTSSVSEETTVPTIYGPESSNFALVKDGDCQVQNSTSSTPKDGVNGMKESQTTVEFRYGIRPKVDAARDGDYLRQLEDRISFLEKPVRKRYRRGTAGEDSEIKPRPQSTIPEVHRVKWSEFKNKKMEEKETYAIEVLEGPAKYWYQLMRQSDDSHSLPTESVEDINIQSSGSSDARARTPDRIRINSLPLMLILAHLSDSRLPTESIVMIRPFKILVYYEKRIRGTLVELERKWAKIDEKEPAEQPGESSQKGNNEASFPSEKHLEPDYEEEMSSVKALRDLRCLVEFIDRDLKPTMDVLKDDSCQKIRFEDLWHIFQPGVEVYAPGYENVKRLDTEPYQELYRVSFTCNGRPYLSPLSGADSAMSPRYKMNSFKIRCYYLDFNGKSFGTVTSDFQIAPFEGERSIRSLEIYPLRFATNPSKIRDRLRQRGEKFVEYTTWRHRYCHGRTLVCQPDGCSLSGKMPVRQPDYVEISPPSELVDSEVIVDFRETLQQVPEWTPKLFWEYEQMAETREVEEAYPVKYWADDEYREHHHDSHDNIYFDIWVDYKLVDDHFDKSHILRDFRDSSPISSSQLCDEDLILLPERVFGYILRLFRYAPLKIDDLQPISPREEEWTNLKLPHGHKKTVQALVQKHFDWKKHGSTAGDEGDEYHESDFIRGKGNGLVILLHGSPGVGKTAAAECAAKANGKPLLLVNGNELVLRPERFEASIRSKFRLAQLWDCVLLLDEADVFLAQRTTADLHRNYLVAVFLRVLEYYPGLVFLTTNRPKELDYAFKSRIDVKLYYPPLTEKQTRSIWKMHVKKTLDRNKNGLLCDEKGILEFASSTYNSGLKKSTKWDARQIRNAFKTALLLAEFEAQNENTKLRRQKQADQEVAPVPVRLEKRHFEMVAGDVVRRGRDGNHIGREDPVRQRELESDEDELSPWPRQPSNNKGGTPRGASSQRSAEQLVDGDGDSD